MTNKEKISFLLSTGSITNQEVYNYVVENKITTEEYQAITGIECPALSLEVVQSHKIDEIVKKSNELLDGGFKSGCLGNPKEFSSSKDDREFIIGLVAKAQILIAGGDLEDKTLNWKSINDPVCFPWQPVQIIKLGVDMSTFMTQNIERKERLVEYVRKLTDPVKIAEVNLETVIPEPAPQPTTADTANTTPTETVK